jgi:hypothetical protein
MLFEEFKKLTTRPQYTQGERGDILEQTVIINSCLLEETNQFRLELAEKVLFLATQCLELELTLEVAKAARAEHDKKCGGSSSTPPGGAGAGGYH